MTDGFRRLKSLLHCNKCARVRFGRSPEGPVGVTWKTKWGVRRVRSDKPTIEEALIAAESLADDPAKRAEIAASLMGVPVEEVQALAAKQAAKSRGRASLVAGRNRAVVVEYTRPRSFHSTSAVLRRR